MPVTTPPRGQNPSALARRAIAFASALSLVLAGACDFAGAGGDAGETDLPEFRRATLFEQRGENDKAIAEYESAIRLHPDNAEAHMNLGLLLHEHSHDYVGAIYHYRTYLARRPSTQKRSMIEDRLRQATQLLAADLSSKLVTSGDNAVLIQQLQNEQKKVAALMSEKSALSTELEQTKGELARTAADRDHLQRRVEMLSAVPLPTGTTTPSQNKGFISEAQGDGSNVQTYVVKKGDSLSHIAEMAYGDPTQWPRIQKANSEIIKGDRVKEGMVLTIP